MIGDVSLGEEEILAKDWTYYDDILVKLSFELDLDETQELLGLDQAAVLGAVIVARSTGTPLIVTSDVLEVRSGRQQIYLSIPGYQISGTLSLEFQISLLEVKGISNSPFAPKKLGNTVFELTRKIVLEGTAPRLPMLPVSFAEHGFAGSSNALWWLRLTTHDLATSASAAIWLWLNSDNDYITRMLQDSESAEAETWLRFLEMDFMRQLLREALNSEELSLEMDYPEESLGHVLSSVVRLLGGTIDQVQQRYREDPGRVEAELQAKVSGKSK
ncbi:hypothetical protein [Paenarthrobacter aromaticivorans]|uniref:Uncharacterized protein n=1 Tax=Paenarthrobacter aromaticivorans TaxID=2849150 RepID=A0ABS6I5G7_9MICC|nr:hypothetical protein [Paenarthrobacter sp. MMS21-TAE1-1]MBU8866627.1 hypothetical protein [Paenarthrobacter sp. MMS21-TAE1-1]